MAGNIIENPVDLQRALTAIAKDVIGSVSNDLMKALQKRIMLDVYEYDPMPRRWYYDKTGRPTFEFLRAFKWEDIKETLSEISKTLFYDYASMGYEPEKFKHGSKLFGDLRERLADILNVNGMDSFNNWGGRERRAYWDNFINEFFADTHELDFLFAKYLLKYQS